MICDYICIPKRLFSDVDILGNHDLTLDIQKIALNFSDGDVNEDGIFSTIKEINFKVNLTFP